METVAYSTEKLDFHPNKPLYPSPADWRDQFIYFMLVDRFDNNDPSVPPYAPGVTSTGRSVEQGRLFQGGNLKGVTRRLDYIKELGCTAVWLSPVLKNRVDSADSYHGYGIQNYLEVDPRFGTLEDLQTLTREAHARGMYVILDIILNHTGDVWAYPGNEPYYYHQGMEFGFGFWREADPAEGFQPDDAVWPVELQNPEAFKRQGEIRNWWNEQEARDGDFLSLKELDLTRSEVLDALIKAYKYWIVNADVDGFRVDTVKHMETSATAIFCNAIREYAQRVGKNNFFLFGEIVAGDEVIERYLGRNSRIEGTNERFPSLDAALDFPTYFVLEEVIKGFSNPTVLWQRYERLHESYADHGEAGRFFVTFVDNHDQMSRPYRRFLHNNPHPRQAVLAITYLLTSQGVPCIYYGTEQGFDGGGDNDCYVRECMFGGGWGAFNSTGGHFFNEENEIYQAISHVARIRRQEPALRFGRQYFREISGNGTDFGPPLDGHCIMAHSRILDTEEVLVALNLDEQPSAAYVNVDWRLSSPGSRMRNLLQPDQVVDVEECNGRAAVYLDMPGHSVCLLKCG